MKHTLEIEKYLIAPSTDDVTVSSEKLPDNQLLCLQHVAIANDTTSGKYATIGVMSADKFLPLETLVMTTATYFYAFKNPVYLHSVKKIAVKFLSPASGDKLRFYAYGYYVD